MRRPIRVLDDEVIDRIAAGEVVEHPAAVVKELVENALDAGARSVHVRLLGGGLTEIRVLDDGRGIPAEEAPMALLRHATSKIESDADLTAVRSLGFRGEALPSIASVSTFWLETGTGPDAPATRVSLGPSGPVAQPAAPRRGTLVVVGSLFHCVPARRKFLKSPRAELQRAHRAVLRAALTRPDVAFTLEADGRSRLKLPAARSLEERARAVFGRGLGERLFPVRLDGHIRVRGLLGPPSDANSNPRRLHVVLNGRPIQESSLLAAVRQAYGPLLGRGLTPPGLLSLEVDPQEVDVNVHPAKSEVRFSEPAAVFRAVLQAVRAAVQDTPWMGPRAVEEPALASPAPVRPGTGLGAPRPWQPAREPRVQPPLAPAPALGTFAALRYLGQVARLFLLCDDGTRLVVIDQHAAHERVLFDQIRAQREAGGLEVQPLLFPDLLGATPEEVELCAAHRAELLAFGLDAEPSGADSIALRGVPALVRHADFGDLVRKVLGELDQGASSPSAEHRLRRADATVACHAAVRAGDHLREEEVRALLADMDRTELATHCPHGRPVVAWLDYDKLAHLFDRH